MGKMTTIFNKLIAWESDPHAGDLDMFDELWDLVKAGIILCFFTMAAGVIVGLAWGWIGRFF